MKVKLTPEEKHKLKVKAAFEELAEQVTTCCYKGWRCSPCRYNRRLLALLKKELKIGK